MGHSIGRELEAAAYDAGTPSELGYVIVELVPDGDGVAEVGIGLDLVAVT